MWQLNEKNFPKEVAEFFPDIDNPEATNKKTFDRLNQKGHFKFTKEKNFAWVLKDSQFPWMPLDIEFPWQDMLIEAKKVREYFIGHRVSGKSGTYYDANRGWLALPIHGISETHTEGPGAYGYSEKTAPYKWTKIADMCPITTKFFKETYPCKEYYRVRFTILQPGGYILPHTDGEHNTLWFVNLVLSNPSGFYFKLKDHGYIPFAPGRAMMLDTCGTHALVNLSNEERIHMIVHGMPLREKGFQDLTLKSYKKVCENPELFWKFPK